MWKLLETKPKRIDHSAEYRKVVEFINSNTSFKVKTGGSSQTELTIKAERK